LFMAEACQRTTGRHLSWLDMVGLNVMQPMPLGKPSLSEEPLEQVRAWIAAGAKND